MAVFGCDGNLADVRAWEPLYEELAFHSGTNRPVVHVCAPQRLRFTRVVNGVLVEGKRCFLFWFDTDPSPGLSFIVSIRGVSRGGVPVTIPDIHFGSGTVRKTFIVP